MAAFRATTLTSTRTDTQISRTSTEHFAKLTVN
jgi:hypothetical protein